VVLSFVYKKPNLSIGHTSGHYGNFAAFYEINIFLLGENWLKVSHNDK